MPGSYGTAAFKSSARKPLVNESGVEVGRIYSTRGIADEVRDSHRLGAAAALRQKAPRFKEQTSKSDTPSAASYTPPGVADKPLNPGRAAVAFRQREARFIDPTFPVRVTGALDAATLVPGLADEIRKKRQGSAAFRATPRFKPPPGAPSVTSPETLTWYVPPPLGQGKTAVDMKRNMSPRFPNTPSPTAAVETWVVPGMAAKVAAAAKTPSAFAMSTERFKAPDAHRNVTSETFYVPPSIGNGRAAVAAFKASPRFKPDPLPPSPGRSRSAEPQHRSPGGADASPSSAALTSPARAASPASVPFRSRSPRFRSEHSETAAAEFVVPVGVGAASATCSATAAFRSKSPRLASSRRDASPDSYRLPSFVDEILQR